MKSKLFLSSFAAVFLSLTQSVEAACTPGQLCNPLGGQFSSVTLFVAGVLKVIVLIALPVIGFFIVLAGFQFIMARGKSEALSTAKTNFMYVLIGAALVLGAWELATLLGATVSQIVG